MTDRIQILTAGSEGRRSIHETFNSYTGGHNDDDSGCILWVCRKERRTERCESAGKAGRVRRAGGIRGAGRSACGRGSIFGAGRRSDC